MERRGSIKVRIAAVIVTYGDRSVYFKKVINRLVDFKPVKYIVLVDNCVQGNSVEVIDILNGSINKLIVVRQGYNSGSAKGFKDGIAKALKKDVDFIWLLDDDNLPQEDTLENLLLCMNTLGDIKKKKYALLSYRHDREIYKKAIENGDPFEMLGAKNSFLGFHFKTMVKKGFVKNNKEKRNDSKTLGIVSVAPYGGLFFHRSLVDIIGLPDEKYFLYGDDFDYSFRITKKGGGIYLVTNSIIKDLEKSFHLKNENEKFISNRLIKTNSIDRIFYSVKNGIVFEQNFVTNKLIYTINAIFHVTLTLIVLVLNPKHLWKFKYYIKGIKASI